VKRKFDFGREILKITAIMAMTLDHIGAILYPELLSLRIVGRIAFPIFAYLLVLGVESTGKPEKYFVTLLSFALISQVPYFFAFGINPFERLNILFTLFLSALTIHFFNRRSLLMLLPFLFIVLFNSEGGIYAIVTVASMKILKEDPKLGILALFMLNAPTLFTQDIQIVSLAALPIIILHVDNWLRMEIEIPENSPYYSSRKYAYYVYYPLHLASLYLIRLLFF